MPLSDAIFSGNKGYQVEILKMQYVIFHKRRFLIYFSFDKI